MAATAARKAAWWEDLGQWLDGLGLREYLGKFQEHDVGPNEIAFLKEHHLVDMGITSVGDRLRIIDSVESFLKAERSRERQSTVLRFRDWHLFPCATCWIPLYEVNESAIVIHDPSPLICCMTIDSLDITTIRDLKLVLGIIFGTVTVYTIDPTIRGGSFSMTLSKNNARKVFGTIKNLWEEDQFRMGRRGADNADPVSAL